MSESKPNPSFRVIVVGAGVAGLVASHCLQRAGIDHIVFERRSLVAPPEGASIAIYPHGSRILHQLGCLELVKQACVPLRRWFTRTPDGNRVLNNGYFGYLEENHGSGLLLLERREFLQILYDCLPDKTPIKTASSVQDIKHVSGGVQVTLANDHVETGDMVLGCDGVYSAVRNFMWEHANKITPELVTVKEKTAFKTRWKSLIGITPGIPELEERDFTVVHNTGHSFLALSQPNRVYFFFIFRLEKPFTWPKRARYTDKDAEDLAQRFADHPVSKWMVFGELWKKRIRGSLVSLEEGVLDHWHSGRIVLAGDSAHKFTPNIALGGNSGMESIVVLCNHLQQMLEKSGGEKPSDEILTDAFASYQLERHQRVTEIMNLLGMITELQAWDTWWYRFLTTWVVRLQPDRAMADQIGEIVSTAAKLNYVDRPGFPSGRLSWKGEDNQTHKSRIRNKSVLGRLSSSLWVGLFGIAIVSAITWHSAKFGVLGPLAGIYSYVYRVF